MPQEYRQILKARRSAGLHARPRVLFAPRRLRGPEKGAGASAEDAADGKTAQRAGTTAAGSHGLRPARARRRGLLLWAEVVVRGSQERQADLPDLQRGRVGAGHFQGQADHPQGPAPVARGHDHRQLRQRRASRLHLHPRGIRRRRKHPEPRARRRPARRTSWARTFSAPATISKSTFTAAPALTSAARKPA